ncbi:S-adenosyl-L-methionine-dependent methyltransferase [Ilyonectria robusta]|uniref:S-adenosyl-L-methionine-dependent methyltransferase n=1 Tax=Ilyonectria robusta TaxID=1079257 RepID=UPI001E8E4404|nr:S-adenosyl-L-methionine-dependent methyltransferase [Ilyonectria robusta]KAH8735131.1 S-adenosyl-L-methionine-dependent methyltransferase [Ilyonectria robusta]
MASGSSAIPAGHGNGPAAAPAQPHHQPQQEGDKGKGRVDEGAETAGAETSASASTPASASASATAQAETYEATHVHAVYEAIAPHFSSTRHKPWPLVAQFLLGQRPGSIGLDVGCGNGKYLRVNPAIHILGSDRSAALVRLAWEGQRAERPAQDDVAVPGIGQVDVAVADGLALPHRHSAVDFVISIAVIHHLSTPARRREAIAALLECVRPREGRVLVYVWALEQASSRRGWDEGSDQDTLVPWVMRKPKGQGPEETFQRYYHLYRKGELEEDAVAAGGVVEDSGYERDNWWVICSRPS